MQDFSLKTQEIKLENALYIVATPIGNLGDITLRSLQALKSADVILCEDTRVSLKLLSAYEISYKKLLTYNDHSDEKLRQKVLEFLVNGNSVVLISDAGTPLISDPGYKLVNFLRSFNQKIIPLPGASSLTAAICSSGLACDNFLFLGFLPNSKIQRLNFLKDLPKNYSLIFFESANRMEDSLSDICDVFGVRNCCVARELTKMHEEIISDNVENMRNFFAQNPQKLRGEFVIIVEKADKNEKSISDEDLLKLISAAIRSKKSLKDLSQEFSEIYGINKKEIYRLALSLKD